MLALWRVLTVTKDERAAVLASIKEKGDSIAKIQAAIKAGKAQINELRKKQRELKQSLRGK